MVRVLINEAHLWPGISKGNRNKGIKNHDQPEIDKVNNTEHSESDNGETSEKFYMEVIADETVDE